ncbi:hypothetical protein WA026_018676 [Henosepilachna vigintioctopunctata]|uniref:Uncharacterized protein n=1 Tax=Henosepilachna vigintioctopunctata TaxID=420089 RepID=A0AAW1U1F7_9CUCU
MELGKKHDWANSSKKTKDPAPEVLLNLFPAGARRGWVEHVGGEEEEEDNVDDENRDINVAKLLAQEVGEDNEYENSEEEGINLQEAIEMSEPGPSRASKRKKRHE